MTSQTSTENSADSKNQEQLKKITHKLAISAASYMADNLTVSDLKFLFEHFAPLQKLIHGLVATLPAPAAAPISTPTAQADKTNALRTGINAVQKELRETKDDLAKTAASLGEKEASLTSVQSQLSKTETELADTKASLNEKALSLASTQNQLSKTENELADTKASLKQTEASLTSVKVQLSDTENIAKNKAEESRLAINKCKATTEILLDEKKELLEKNKKLNKDLVSESKKKQEIQEKLAHIGSAPAELALLREDTALAQALSLSTLPSGDIEALIHIVAVLAQRDNLERLWDILKDRCENENRPANAAERALLSTALAWYNYNWRTHPYNLIEVSPTAAYDFNAHLRNRHTTTGEIIVAQHLPGIIGSNNEQVRKALVITR